MTLTDSWRPFRVGHTTNDPHLVRLSQLLGRRVPSRPSRDAAILRPGTLTATSAGSVPSRRRVQSEAEQARARTRATAWTLVEET